MSLGRLLLALPLLLSTAACSSTVFKTVNLDEGKSVSVDAKQRLVLVTKEGGPDKTRTVVCAEPSPDSMTARTAAASLGFGTPEIGANASGSSSEMAASIAMRTQTIQLLRDGYFRLCEAYMNGAISKTEYTIAVNYIPEVMIPLMVVDTISGTPRAPAVVIGAGGLGTDTTTKTTSTVDKLLDATKDATGTVSFTSDSSAKTIAADTVVEIEEFKAPNAGLQEHETLLLGKVLEALAVSSRLPTVCLGITSSPEFQTIAAERRSSVEQWCEEIMDAKLLRDARQAEDAVRTVAVNQ